MSRQKELDADPKAIQQIEFIGKLKMMIVKMLMVHNSSLTILEKIKQTKTKILSRKCNSLIIVKDDKL